MKIIRFLVSGASAAGVEYASFLLLQNLTAQKNLFLSQTVSFLCGFVVSFLLNKYWVFKSDQSSKSELAKYAVLAGINLVLTNVVIHLLADQMHVVQWLSKLIVMGMVAAWNYVIFSRLIFGRNVSKSTSEKV